MFVVSSFRRLVANAVAKQAALLIGLQIVAMIASFALTILIVRGLDIASYGTYRYVMTYLALGMTILHLGVPYSASRLLALESDRFRQKEIVGTCIIFVTLSSTGGVLATFMTMLFVPDLPTVLLWAAPALGITLGHYMTANICRGLNRISLLASQQVLPYAILLPVTAIQVFVLNQFSLTAALVGYIASFSIVLVLGPIRLGTSFSNWKYWIQAIRRENRATGMPIYLGGVLAVASGHFVVLWAAAFASPIQYGHYALGLAISAPLGILVSSIGTVIFRSSAQSNTLSKDVIVWSIALGGLMAILYFAGTRYLLTWAFGDHYYPSVLMAQALGIASLMIGWGDILQRFLGAHGLGRSLGIAAAVTGAVGTISAAALMQSWQAYGAIVAAVAAAITYLSSMIAIYLYWTKVGFGHKSKSH